MHSLRSHTMQQAVQAGYHQALDMVGITVAQCLVQRLTQTAHVGLAAPEKRRQSCIRTQCVAVGIRWHARPVDPAYVLAPAKQLTDKTFDTRERCSAVCQGAGGHADCPGGIQ